MKKYIFPIVLILVAALLCGCTANNNKNKRDETETMKYATANKSGHQIYVREPYGEESLQATFINSDNGESEIFEMEKIAESADYNTYTTYGDTKKYNKVYFSCDGSDATIEFSFNEYVNGYQISGSGAIPFIYDEEEENISYETVGLKYGNTKKNIFIWTPNDYDENDRNKKYSVIYLTDGQNLFDKASTTYGSWGVAESAKCMMAESNNRCIIVGIDNGDGNRDSELTPNIGNAAEGQEKYNNGTGKAFSDFICNTVMPYIEKNYNVYTDSQHNSICGSSSGGIEAFYIGMEHPDKFGTVGALSPAFLIFGEKTWDNYLGSLSFDNNHPFVYIYNGQGDELETSLCTGARDMVNYLEKIDYPKDKIAVNIYKNGAHNETYWRAIFPEFLKYAFE